MKLFILASLLAVTAFGGPVTYTLTAEAVGTLDGLFFSDLITVKTVVDSADPFIPVGLSYLSVGAQVGTINVTIFFFNPSCIAFSPALPCVGVTVGGGPDFIDIGNTFFSTWAAGTPTAVIPSAQAAQGNPSNPFTTSLGALQYWDLQAGTFQATDGTFGDVPEPGTLALALAGLAAVAVRKFRR